MAPTPQFLTNLEAIEIQVSYSWYGPAHVAVQAAAALALTALLAVHRHTSLAIATFVFGMMTTGLLVHIALAKLVATLT